MEKAEFLYEELHNKNWIFAEDLFKLYLIYNSNKESNLRQPPSNLAEISLTVQLNEAELDLRFDNCLVDANTLLPTQARLNANNSILKQFTNSWNCLDDVLTKPKLQTIEGPQPILTFGKKYIIDGHHRWSQYMMSNPIAKIEILNIPLIRHTDITYRIQNEYLRFKARLKNYMVENEIGTCYDEETFFAREEERNSFRITYEQTIKLVLDNITEYYINTLYKHKKIENPTKQKAMDYCVKNLRYFLNFVE